MTLTDVELTRIFFALVLLLTFAHFFGYLFHRFKLPRVIGEIIGGLLVGPSGVGFLFPRFYNWVFNAFESEGKLISLVYWLGLVFLMFISGFEIQKAFDREDRKIVLAVLLGSTVIPFLAGWVAPSVYDFSPYLGINANMSALKIVIGIATAVTSIPVISKIFIDLDIVGTTFAKIVLATATVHDVILWVALAVATGLVSSEALSVGELVSTVLITLVFFGVALLLLPRLIKYTSDLRFNLLIKSSAPGYVLLICFLFSAAASILKVNIVFGAFLAGIVLGLIPQNRFENEKRLIKEISLAFFIPLYFAIVGMKLDLIHYFEPLFFLGFLLFTTLFQTVGTLAASKLTTDWRSSFNLAVAMNTRGGPGIVLATIALELGIINQALFVTLVLIAITTSLLAGYWFKHVISRGWPLLKDTSRV